MQNGEKAIEIVAERVSGVSPHVPSCTTELREEVDGPTSYRAGAELADNKAPAA